MVRSPFGESSIVWGEIALSVGSGRYDDDAIMADARARDVVLTSVVAGIIGIYEGICKSYAERKKVLTRTSGRTRKGIRCKMDRQGPYIQPR